MTREDWKDIFKSWMTMALYYIEVVIFWLLFTWTSLLFLLTYVNNFQDVGLMIGLGLLAVAILFWVSAVSITVKMYNIVTKIGKLNRNAK